MTEKKYDLVVFDFDGTLADSKQGIARTVIQAVEAAGHAPPKPEQVFPLIGLSLEACFATLTGLSPGGLDCAALAAAYREIYDAVAPGETPLFDGVRDLLEVLRAARIVQAVATSKRRQTAELMLRALGIADHFAALRGADDVSNGKPHPEMMLALCAELGVAPSRTLLVGDTTFDLEMGRAAGTDTCAVTYGVHSAEVLKRERPTYLVHAPEDVLPLILP